MLPPVWMVLKGGVRVKEGWYYFLFSFVNRTSGTPNKKTFIYVLKKQCDRVITFVEIRNECEKQKFKCNEWSDESQWHSNVQRLNNFSQYYYITHKRVSKTVVRTLHQTGHNVWPGATGVIFAQKGSSKIDLSILIMTLLQHQSCVLALIQQLGQFYF